MSASAGRAASMMSRPFPASSAFPPTRRETLALGGGVLVVAACIAYLSLGRGHASYGTETDFLGAFVPEAARLLAGESLEIAHHPPMYAAVLASVQTLVGEWFRSGLLLSWLAALVALGSSVWLFGLLGGRAAAWGSLVALGTSHVFLEYSAQATSDTFFLALYCGIVLLALRAFYGPGRRYGWLGLGLAIGVALLSRTNALTLLAFAATPWLIAASSRRERVVRTAWIAGGVALPVATWGVLAWVSGSPFAPSGNTANVAMTYFGGGDRISYEHLTEIRTRFGSLWEVLAYDPVHVIRQYARDLFDLPHRVFSGGRLLLFPLELFALPGLVLFFFAPAGRFKLLLGVAALLQIALLNLKAFEYRYYLFLVPLIGAGAGLAIVLVLRYCQRWAAAGIVLALSVYVSANAALAVERVRLSLGQDEHEVAAAAEAVQGVVPVGSGIVTRKPHIPYYARGRPIYLPEAGTIDALRDSLIAGGTLPDYLFFGKVEHSRRPGLRGLLEPGRAPEWLEPVVIGEGGRWVLYRITGLRPDSPSQIEVPEATDPESGRSSGPIADRPPVRGPGSGGGR